LPLDRIRALARAYATIKPAAILLGWGLNKYQHSAEIFRSIDALGALCGHIGVPGGGVTHGFATQRHFDKTVEAEHLRRHHRMIPEPLLGRGLLDLKDPRVRMMMINGGNPVNRCPTAPMVPFADGIFSTASGKFEFIGEMRNPHRTVPGFPLTLVTNFSRKWLLSQMLEKDHPAIPFVRIGTETARAFGIADRDTVIIRSPVGYLTVQALVDPGVGRGMVIMPVGTWIKRGGGANVLTEDVISNFGEMAAYGQTRVTLERVGTAEAAPVADASAALA
jgi:anaerobic selenocysteine-containing dehydrogenase